MEAKAAVAPAPTQAFTLPVLIFGVVEVRRLKREIEALEEYMQQMATRQPGQQPALPRVSRMLDTLASDNHLNLLLPDQRTQLAAFLNEVETSAPGVHISFSSDPSASFTAKVVSWLRANVHPHALLQIGLQPTIAAGCVVRTTNKIFDFSLRQRFTQQKPMLLQALDARQPEQPMAVAPAPALVTPPAPAQEAPVPIQAAAPTPAVATSVPAPAPVEAVAA